MKLKSYFSATVEAAVELAHRELGADALLVNARPASPETRHLGAYEVVFGSDVELAPATPSLIPLGDTRGSAAAAVSKANDLRQPYGSLSQDVAGMRREIEGLAKSLCGVRIDSVEKLGSRDHSNSSGFGQHLLANELDATIAHQVARGAPLEQFFEVDATLGRRATAYPSCAVVALVGPPGAGKTTTLIKLAARYGLNSRRPTQIISTDVYRIAAADQLRSLASILGIGCDVVETSLALAQALEEHRLKELVFIDTPGLADGDMEDGADLAMWIATHPEIDTHLVLPASMKPADMSRSVERYTMFYPKKLLFTRLDETDRFGALISQAAARQLPISFLATGQQIPDDLEPATKTRLIELTLGASRVGRNDASGKSIGAIA